MHHGEARIVSEPLARHRHGLGILVETQQAAARPQAIEDRATVSAPSEGAIYISTIGTHRERVHRLGQQHGLMFQGTAHRRSSAASGDRSSKRPASSSQPSRAATMSPASQISNFRP